MNIVIGDDISLTINLQISNLPFVIPNTSVIKVAIVDKSNTKLLAGPVLAPSTNSGSNWAASTVVAIIPGRLTASIPFSTPAKLEIQINDGITTRTWFANVSLIKGLIK